MKEISHFACDICHTEYRERERCAECEESHRKPVRIFGSHYVAQDKNLLGYPISIDVEFENGNIKTYKYQNI